MTGKIPARAVRLAVALLASIAVVAIAAVTASASPTAGGTAPLTSGVQRLTSYAPKTSEPYEFNFTADEFYGPVHCVGKHQTNERKGYPGNATEGGRDVERCRSTTGEPLKGMAPGETATDSIEGYSEWGSDWDGNAIVSTNFSYKVSAGGKSFKIIAYYPYAG